MRTKKLTIGLDSPNNLEELIEVLREDYYLTEVDFKNVTFELDWGEVFYQGDNPDIVVVIKK